MHIDRDKSRKLDTMVGEMKHHFVELARTNNIYHLLSILDYAHFILKLINYTDTGSDLDIRCMLLKFYPLMRDKQFVQQFKEANAYIECEDYEAEANIITNLCGGKTYMSNEQDIPYTPNFTIEGEYPVKRLGERPENYTPTFKIYETPPEVIAVLQEVEQYLKLVKQLTNELAGGRK